MAGNRIIATVEARMTSSRLPGKVLMPAGGKPLLQILLERLQRVPELDGITLATTVNETDDAVAALGETVGVEVFRGSEFDVLGRVRGALDQSRADTCVEITGDCPLIDPAIVSDSIAAYIDTRDQFDYVSNSDPHRSVPAGLDVQVFAADALRQLDAESDDPNDREHVSYSFYRPEAGDRWRPRFITHGLADNGADLLVTLDYAADYALIRQLHEEVSASNSAYGAAELIDWIRAHPDLHDACRRVRQPETAS